MLLALADEINSALRRTVAAAELPPHLAEAVEYALLSGGKRLRPALVLLCCEAVGGRREAGMPAAVALELIHTFSLVHDDLPSMDDDALRRGRPTLHVHAGEAMATLAGDAMISIAFGVLAETPPAIAARLVGELASGTTAMITGQVYDTLGGVGSELSAEAALRLVHRNKTGALLRCACRMGALCGGAGPETFEHLTRYGEAVGLMFQIVDDLLDVTQSTEHLGKMAGKDISAGKLTYPGVLGVDRSRSEVERLAAAARSAVEPLGSAAHVLRTLSDDMAVRTR
ncbi:MAG: polyprenyl synthetase family protein [Phycisphaerales bacterium]|nr:polyprenyl synthetase family protein [Phycisphaerae bacterium]NNF44680.1 polyprenyl synthetase family protein [Phycisphaerales bacterium]NNM27838.1 polyprenyl synthetase family protein [Phycisphaerales bacterium]